MNKRFLPVALVAALATVCILGSTLIARADNYPIRDGTGASQTFCSKLSGGLQYPCHLMYGMFGSTPVPISSDGSNLNVNVQASVLPSGASTSAGQTTANSSLSSIATNTSNNAAYNAPFSGVTAMTADVTATAGRSVGANCTVAGNLNVTFTDASTLTVQVTSGWQAFPFAVTKWNSGSTTATCSVYELK